MTILRLSLANLKKKKSLTATLVFLSLLATLFLNIGLMLSDGMDGIYAKRAEALNSPDFFVVTENAKYQTKFEEFLQWDERVDYVEKEEVIYMENCENSANSLKMGAVIFNKEKERNIETFHILEEDSSIPEEEMIYLPLMFKSNGVSLGDSFSIYYKNMEFPFLVAGFYEATYYGNTSNAFLKYFVPGEKYDELYQKVGAGTALSAKIKENLPRKETSEQLKSDFIEETDFYANVGGLSVIANCRSGADMEETIASLLAVPMILTIAFAFIICVIVSVVVHFKVKEEIEDSMTEIGSLQAMGYTTGQIMKSVVGEFGLAGIVGGIVGILLSYVVLPYVMTYGNGVTGIITELDISVKTSVISLMVILLLMVVSAWVAAIKIKKISPVTALRKGLKTHHFGKNFFPLHKGTGSLRFQLALKNAASNLRQSVTTILIIALGTFAMGITIVMYMNFKYDSSAILKMVGMEVTDIQVKLLPHEDAFAFGKELEKMEEVRKTNVNCMEMLKVDGEDTLVVVSADFEKMEILSAVKGEEPVYDNEMVLTSALMKKLDKEIGDTVQVTVNGISREYYIVGTSMGTNNSGKMGMMTLEGMKRVAPYYVPSQLDVYLKEEINTKDFMEKLYDLYGLTDSDTKEASPESDGQMKYESARKKAEEQIKIMLEQYGVNSVEYAVMLDGEIILSGNSSGYKIKEMLSLEEYLDGQLKSYTMMMSGMIVMVLFIMLAIMGAIISITVKAMLRKQREEFGIYKAMGYTTGDLMKMISMNFTMNAVIGAFLGVILCKLSANNVLQMFFVSMSMDMVDFNINGWWLVGTGVMTVLYIFLFSMWKAYKVRRITVYDLLTE